MRESEKIEIIGRVLPREHVGEKRERVWLSLSENAFDNTCVSYILCSL